MPPIRDLIEPDRVHRSVYTDQAIFDREIDRIFETIWVYCGHESQIRNPGDYHTVQIGRQPMVMVRTNERKIACSTTAARIAACNSVAAPQATSVSSFVCSYHAWTFHLDGRIKGIPLTNGLRRHAT